MEVFKRYTEQAKRAINFARNEAIHRKSPFITAADLLVGLTWEEGSRADRCAELKNRAVEFRALLGIAHRPSTDTPYDCKEHILLNDDGKKVLAYATFESDRRADYWIDSDHLLRAIMRFDNPARQALESVGLTLSELRVKSRASRRESPPARIPMLRFVEYWFIHFGLVLALVVAMIIGLVHSFMNNWSLPLWQR
jgi:ATP-dependent Clp protease ATP-binding subunit ClpA